MNTLGITPLPDDVCMICQQRPATKAYTFDRPRGHGSCFDGETGVLLCCRQCDDAKFAKWFYERPTKSEWGEHYRFELELFEFLEALPVNSQERFWNHATPGGCQMDSQDWIDLHLGELSEEKRKEFGFDDELFDTEYEV